MSTQQGGTLAHALENGRKLLGVKPALAEEQAREILKVDPGPPDGDVAAGLGAPRAGRRSPARARFWNRWRARIPTWRRCSTNSDRCSARSARTAAASRRFTRAAQVDQNNPAIWRALGDQYTLIGDSAKADEAYARSIKASVNDPELMEAAAALCENRLAVAERLLREFLKAHPTDVAAIRMLAETGARLGAYDDAEKLLARALELAPGLRRRAAQLCRRCCNRQIKSEAALEQVDMLLKQDPRSPGLSRTAGGGAGAHRRV